MNQEQEACASCRFWKATPENGNKKTTGQCRYSTPAVIGVAGIGGYIVAKTYWPITSANGWCGKWERKG